MRTRDTDPPPPPPRRAGGASEDLGLWVHSAAVAEPWCVDLAHRVTLSVGRDDDATVATNDPYMSRVHFRLAVTPGGEPGLGPWLVEDEGSRNGLRINGRPSNRAVLEPGDVVRAGATVFVLDYGCQPDDALGLVGNSRGLERVRTAVRQAGRLGGPVYVTGESGSGKEVVAHALHMASGRPGPFIAVNMASLVQGLCESQLFGHRRGAFSGAVADQLGVFDVAKGGTLLLDELGEMDLGLQAKLLRAVETNEIHRLGDPQPHPTDIRLVVATHRDLRRMVQQGRFREDLSWRLQRTRIDVPPLRARRLDVLPLLLHFLAEAGVPPVHELTRMRPRTGWHAADLFEQMLLHSWPGNVRELRDDAVRLADAILGRMSEHESGPLPPVEEIMAPRGPVGAPATPQQGYHITQPTLKPLPEASPDEVLRCVHLLENQALLQQAIRDDVNGNIKALAEHVAHVLGRPVAGVRRAIYRTLGGTVASVRAQNTADVDMESQS